MSSVAASRLVLCYRSTLSPRRSVGGCTAQPAGSTSPRSGSPTQSVCRWLCSSSSPPAIRVAPYTPCLLCSEEKKEGNALFNNTLNTFIIRLYGIGYIVKDHSVRERGNPLSLLHGLLFSISSKGSFISTIPQTG